MKFKTICFFGCCIFLILFLVGCTTYNPSYNKLDDVKFISNYKQDSTINIGRKSAQYDNRIYYLGSQDGTSGIYSMGSDGSDVVLETEVADIRKMQVFDDKILYAGYVGEKENDNGAFRSFELFMSEGAAQNIVDVSSEIDNAMNVDNLWDFYALPSGEIITAYLGVTVQANLTTYVYSIDIPHTSYEELTDRLILRQMPKYTEITLYKYKNMQMATDKIFPEYYEKFRYDDNFICSSYDVSIIETDNEVKVMGGDYINENAFGGLGNYILQSINSRGYLFSYKGQLILIDINKKEALGNVEIPNSVIQFVLDLGDKAYIIAKDESNNQSILSVDLNTFEYKLMKQCERGNDFLWLNAEKVLWLDENKAVTVKDKTISVWSINDDSLSESRKISLPQKIVNPLTKTDVAGDWLFVYEFNYDQDCDILKFKINLSTGNVYYS